MNTEMLNRWGEYFLNFAWPMLWQSSLLIGVIFILDLALRRKVRTAVRYLLWLVVLVKLILPPTLALPTGPSWWIHSSAPQPVKIRAIPFTVTHSDQTMPDLQIPLPPVPIPQRPVLSFAALALALSGIVSAGLLAWLLIRWRGVSRKIRNASEAEGLDAMLKESARMAGPRSAVQLKLTGDSMSPAVCGLFRPVILLPQSLVEKLSAGQLRAVLLHELIHLRRGDVWVNCAQALLQIVYWWHPLLWLANARIRRVREEAVDDAVMLTLRDDADIYAPTLLEVAKFTFRRPLASLGLVGILESRSALRQRIERLMDFDAPRKAGLTVVSILGILAFSAVALPMGQAPTNIAPTLSGGSSDSNQKNSSIVTTENFSNRTDDVRNQVTMSFKIERPINESDLKKLFLDVGVKIPPTVLVYMDSGILLVRGSEEQQDLIERVVLKLNGVSPKEIENFVNRSSKQRNAMTGANLTLTNLEMRVFKVDTNTFASGLRKIPGLQTNNVATMYQSFSSKLGVDLTAPGRSVAYGDKLGLLFVKATPSELDTIERVVQALNQIRPEIHIKARFIEVPKNGFVMPPTLTNIAASPMIGILSSEQMIILLQSLREKPGVETLAEPEVTTSGGRQTQMRATGFAMVVTNFAFQEAPSNSTAIIPQVGMFEIGPTVDVVPRVLDDDFTIDLTTIVTQVEFIGYEQSTNVVFATNNIGKKIQLPTVSPGFHIQKADAHAILWDNQTLVLGNLKSDFVGADGQIHNESKFFQDVEKKNGTADKEVLVFITATIIDPAGNRVHSDDEFPNRPAIPPQPR